MKKIAVLGDSITAYMPYFLDKKMKIGFDVPMVSDKLPNSDILFYICGILDIGVGDFHKFYWPRVVKDEMDGFVLLLGVNNILRPDCDDDNKETIEDTFEKLKSFMEDILSTDKYLLVQTLYPTKYPEANKKIGILNEKIKSYCQNNSIDYLDLDAVLEDEDGLLNQKFSDDGLHPNETGYKIIVDKLSKKINNELQMPKTKKL